MTTNYTNEQLKKLAEFADCEVWEKPGYNELFTRDVFGREIHYDPLHNDAQAFELLRELTHRMHRIEIIEDGDYTIIAINPDMRFAKTVHGQTLNEAICSAVLALLEVSDGL